jgi:hypothetical protein
VVASNDPTARRKEAVPVQFDLAVEGLGLLIVISLAFGAISQLVLGRGTTHWLWLVGAGAYFIGGLVASEVVWGTLTVDDIQPIIGGLAFDESLLGGLVLGIPVVLVTWYFTRHGHMHRPTPT